jgi:type VI secretion system secreted protein VgrG
MPEMALQMELVTAFGDKLQFRSMSALEEVSRLFELQIVAISESADLDADAVLGSAAAVSLETGPDRKRWFHGIVAAFGLEDIQGRFYTYRLTLRPWLWLLTRSSNLRIWQEMTALDIVKDVFSAYEHNLVDNTSGSYGQRVYCVQYRESDFNFVSRLLEEEGIHYFFRHHEDRHELVLADDASANEPVEGFDTVRYMPAEDLHHLAGVTEWRMRHEVQPGKFTLSDYNFETPSTSLLSNTVDSQRSHAQHGFEVYDYPGLHVAKAKGDTRAQIRADEMASRFARYTAHGNVTGLAAGAKVTLAGHPRAALNAAYLVLQTQIEMQIAGYESSDDVGTQFGCRVLAQPYAEPFRPARVTHKPSVAGPQTALVVGSGGDGAIHTDEHGRIKVQFFWDRLGAKDAQSSCWVRVASQWAGNGWGMIALPRIGQEVVVDFLEGDPDQPIIVGRVHNAEQKTPYPLPDNATVSTIKSRSKQGGAADFNELRFEDDPGSEYVLLHAQKDRLEFVENTLKSRIDVDEHRTVKNDRRELIEGSLHQVVKVDAKQKVAGKLHQAVTGSMLFKTDDIWSLTAAADITAKTDAALSFKAADIHVKGSGNIGIDGQNVHIKAGANVVIEAGTQLSLKVGGSVVVIEAAGVSIVGPLVKINSGGAAGSGAGCSPVAPTAPEAPDEAEPPEDPLAHR